MNNAPDFICIGMQKAGTTWLAANLGQHPDVWIPPIKEIHYFDEVHVDPDWHIRRRAAAANNLKRLAPKSKGKAVSKEMAFWQHMEQVQLNDAWYKTIWSTYFYEGSKQALGELTPDYSILPLTGVEHVFKIAPTAKIIILLRDPVERTWSSTRMFAKEQGHDPAVYYKEQFIIDRSRIVEMLEKWEKVFPEKNVFIAFYEDVANRPYWLLESTCKFLGIGFNKDYFQEATEKVHVGASSNMPEEVLEHYKMLFHDDIVYARDRFKSYAADWFATYY